MLCTRCKKNLAVIFISKMNQDGTQANEGYCLSCARSLNLEPLNKMIENLGIDPEEMESMNRDMMDMMREMNGGEDIDPEMLDEMLGEEDESEFDDSENDGAVKKSPLSFLNNMMKGSFGGDRGKANEETAASDDSNNKRKKEKNRKFLNMYGTNLTAKARDGLVDRVIGRDAEIARITQILNRRTKNNPVLLGEPGVGKTAVAEGLALRIAEGKVPEKLLGCEIYMLDMAAMVAGTQFRGQFESRLKSLVNEVKTLGNIILVIDEVHILTKAGDADGAMNAGNILKPALSRGEIRIIGATTPEEYRKYIEKDSALERRFQTVMVEEPSVDETIEMLKGIRSYYEEYHRVKISDEIIRCAAVLSKRYITDRFLPDKAIDVIDEAASRANLENEGLSEYEKLKKEEKRIDEEIEGLNAELDGRLDTQREAAEARQEKGEELGRVKDSEGLEIYERLAELKSMRMRTADRIAELEAKGIETCLTADDLASVIESWTKIPVKNITEFETNRLINLEERLHRGLVGQEEAVEAVSRGIRRKRAGIGLKRRPASFIFVGPTGVGKTELVKQLAREVFDSEDALIRLDMSEFMEKHSAAKLIGSPPGYVGYDDAGQLTERIRRHPYSVILLDEIEKAHPDIFNMLLQILDDGRITDSHGKTVSFENTIIVMTSNAGSDRSGMISGFGANADSSAETNAERALRQIFRPEFLNRVDEIVVFRELNEKELSGIAELMLKELGRGLAEKSIEMTVSDAAKLLICRKSCSKTYGARPMRRYIERNLEDKIAQMYISGELKEGSRVFADCDGDEISVRVTP